MKIPRLAAALALLATPCAAQDAREIPAPLQRDTSRFAAFAHDAVKPMTWGRPIVLAVMDQARDRPDGWSEDSDGMGRRFAARGGQAAISLTVRHGMAALLRQPVNPVRCATTTGGARLAEAALEPIANHACGGGVHLAVPRIAARVASGFAPLAWHQPDFTASKAARGVAIGFATSALIKVAIAAIRPD